MTVHRLDASQKQSVSYCIPLELRDLQIAAAIKRVPGRIQPAYEARPDPVGVACFGPSLADTWEELRAFPCIISCSGAHKFLVDRGIVPTFHVEVDPRPHKIQLIGEPQRATTYLIASTCHPKLFDHLKGFNVLLWHVFDAKEDGLRILPRGEWCLTGGCDVGSRALTIAGFLGFRDVHVFGMDGCEKLDGSGDKHAAAHPNESTKHSITEWGGREYRTTPGLLEAARQVWHELDEMPAVRATFHGEGLVQAMARDYRAKDATQFSNIVAMQKPTLISVEYAALNRQLHESNLTYGMGGAKHVDIVRRLCEKLGTTSVLDYGCGKGLLARALAFPIWEYDPAVEGKTDAPRAADVVVCTDVLEHVEPDRIQFVLADLKRCVRQIGYFVIHTGPSGKTLADGRNTHVLQRDRAWWKKKLGKFFLVGQIFEQGPLLTIIVAPKAVAKPGGALVSHTLTPTGAVP